MTAAELDAGHWLDRWDRQQEGYLPDRELRFTVLIDAVAAITGAAGPLVVDLGCGPGSLGVRLLDTMPGARVIGVDADPVLLALGRAGYAGRAGLSFVDADLRHPGWVERLGLDRPVDAVVSTTALHWLDADGLRRVYRDVAGLLGAGGVLLNGDHMALDQRATPVLAATAEALEHRQRDRRSDHSCPEDWAGWWAAVLAEPGLAGPVAERARRRYGHHDHPQPGYDEHLQALRSAGFPEVGSLWQYGTNRVLAAIR